MLTTIRYVLLTALRDRLFAALAALVLLAVMFSAGLGSTAMLETQQMIVVYAAGSARIILITGLIVFVCFHIRTAFEMREIEIILSRPLSRASLVIAYGFGFTVVAGLLVAPIAGLITWLGHSGWTGFGGWSISLWLEAVLVVAVSLFAALTLRSAVSAVLVSLGVYVLARMMGFFLITGKSGMLFHVEGFNMVARAVLKMVSTVVPRLDFFAKSEWLVYGMKPGDWHLFLLQAAIFIPLLVIAGILDFKRKQF